MRPRVDPRAQELLAYLTDALDPGERQRLEARLRVDPGLRARLEDLRRPPPWRPPLHSAGMRLQAADLRMSGAADARGTLPPGALLEVEVAPGPEPETRGVVLLEQRDGAWQVLSPAPGQPPTPLSRYAPDPRGARHLPLRAPTTPGEVAWMIVLCPGDLAPAWDELDPWEALKEAVVEGRAETLQVYLRVR